MKIIILIFIFLNSYFCCDDTQINQINNVKCVSVSPTNTSCSGIVNGNFVLKSLNSTVCLNLLYLNNIVGTFTIKVINVELIPSCSIIYYTTGFDYFTSLLQFKEQQTITYNPIKDGKSHAYRCSQSSDNCLIPNNPNLINRHCGVYNDVREYNYVGYTDCSYFKYTFQGELLPAYLSYYYAWSIIPKPEKTYKVIECGNGGNYKITVSMKFTNKDNSGLTNKGFLSQNEQTFIFSPPFTNVKYSNVIFTSDGLDNLGTIFNLPTQQKFLIPPNFNNASNKCWLGLNVNNWQDFSKTNLGEYQSFTYENIFNSINDPIQQTKINTPYNYNGFTYLSKTSSKISKNPFFSVFNGNYWTRETLLESQINRLGDSSSSLALLLGDNTIVKGYQLRCDDKKNLNINFLEPFIFPINYQLPSNYSFSYDVNIVCPQFISPKCDNIDGYQNSIRGANITVYLTSTCLDGTIEVNIDNTNTKYQKINGKNTIQVSKGITTKQVINFSIYNVQTEYINMNFTFVANGGTIFCIVPFKPKSDIPENIDYPPTTFITTDTNFSPNENECECQFIVCYNCGTCQICEWFKEIFDFDDIVGSIIAIIIVIIIGVILFSIIYGIIKCVITQTTK